MRYLVAFIIVLGFFVSAISVLLTIAADTVGQVTAYITVGGMCLAFTLTLLLKFLSGEFEKKGD